MIKVPAGRLGRSLLAGIIVASLISFALFLRAAFAGEINFSPEVFVIAGLKVRWYGLLIAISIAVGLPWALRRATKAGANRAGQAETVFWWAIFGGLVGARLAYVAQNLTSFGSDPTSVWLISDGGLSIHGMIFGGLIAGAISARLLELPFWLVVEAAVPPTLLGMILGRFGNFANHELFGYPTEVPWKMFVPEFARPETIAEFSFYHPVFLYDAGLNLLLLLVLLRTQQSLKFPGELFFRFLLGIGLTRFVVEFWRISDRIVGPLSSAQILSLVLAVVALSFIILGRAGRLRLDRYLISKT